MKNFLFIAVIFLFSAQQFAQQTQLTGYLIDLGRFKMPISNSGIFGDFWMNTYHTGAYDGKPVIFSGGFLMSGYDGNKLWVNGVLSASRIEDYLPGHVGSNANDPINTLYVIEKGDPAFGESWQKYRNAVSIGAAYYDGNKDGKYEPKDLNGDGKWDENEDCPDILGDITVWCVYNDGVPKYQRRFYNVNPLGIEIHQTVFAFFDKDIIFVRYKIVNKGTVTEKLDSIIFSALSDNDIGNYTDDMSGCDSLLNIGYNYNKGADDDFGTNPPAIGILLIQGPPVYLKGETYIDINANNKYDDGIDDAIDTAYQKNGYLLKQAIFPGAKNQIMTSFNSEFSRLTFEPPPWFFYRLFQKGFNTKGERIDVCSWPDGTVLGNIDCNNVNPFFHYSGDRINMVGWVDNTPSDERILLSTGEFTLLKDTPVDIWIAYVVGRGVDSLDSVTKMKRNAGFAKAYYEDWYMVIPDEAQPIKLPADFRLYQNFPNPFNSMTKIRYDIPQVGSRTSLFVNLKVYDLLGNEIAELVNEEKTPGSYEVTFESDKLSSGIYIYRIKTLGYQRYKKMVLIK